MKLEGLLYQDKNKGLKEAFFKEEYLTQIRALHGMMHRLVARIEERLRQESEERDEVKQSDALTRQAEYVSEFLQSMRDNYKDLTRPAPVSWSKIQQAQKEGNKDAVRAIQARGKRTGHWAVLVRPSWIPAHPQIETLKDCWSIVETSCVRSNGWEYPVVTRGARESGQDWVGATRTHQLEVESWRLSQKGLFAHMFPIWDDVEMSDGKPIHWPWDLPKDFAPQHFLDVDVAIRTLTHVYRFAANLAGKAFAPGDGVVEVTVCLTGTRDRVLMAWNDIRRLRDCYRATEPTLENTWRCPREELRSAPDGFAIKAAVWFFERFGWHEVSAEGLSQIQRSRFSAH